MRILHLINVHAWTGPADYVIKISKFLHDNNENVLVGFRTFYKGIFKNELIRNSIPFTEKLKFPRGFKPYFFIKDNLQLRELIDNFSPEIIHCHNTLENIHSAILKSHFKFKLIRTVYNLRTLKKKPFSSLLFNQNDFLIAVCEDYKNRLINMQNVPPQKIKIIRGFVDTEKFSPEKSSTWLLEKCNIDNNFVKIGMVARFQEKRGHKFLIYALKKLLDNGYNNIRLILTGRGEYLEPTKILVHKLGMEDFVIFTGYIRDELPELLSSLDIFVLLQEGSDGTCRAVLEAMATGLPVVTVKRGALVDTVKDNFNGFFIEKKENIDELYFNLKKLVDNKQLREYMGENSRDIVERDFSVKSQLEKYYNFYREIINEKNK